MQVLTSTSDVAVFPRSASVATPILVVDLVQSVVARAVLVHSAHLVCVSAALVLN